MSDGPPGGGFSGSSGSGMFLNYPGGNAVNVPPACVLGMPKRGAQARSFQECLNWFFGLDLIARLARLLWQGRQGRGPQTLGSSYGSWVRR